MANSLDKPNLRPLFGPFTLPWFARSHYVGLGPFWADLGGPQIYNLSLYLFAAGTKNTEYPRTGLKIGLRG